MINPINENFMNLYGKYISTGADPGFSWVGGGAKYMNARTSHITYPKVLYVWGPGHP